MWSEIPDGCKPLTPLSTRRIFCHLQHLLFSGINFIFLPCKKWTDELQISWQAPHKHILVLTHWGVSKMWSQVTHFLSPWANLTGVHILKDKNTWKTWIDHVSTMKILILWLPFEHFQVGGERRWVSLPGNGRWTTTDTAKSSSGDHPQGEYKTQGPVRGTTTVSKATTVTTAQDCGRN